MIIQAVFLLALVQNAARVGVDSRSADADSALRLMQGSNLCQSIPTLKRLEAMDEHDISRRAALIEAFSKCGRTREAEAEVKAALDSTDFSLPNLLELADILLRGHEDAAAQQVLQYTASKSPDSAQARAKLGRLYYQEGRFPDAARELLSAVQLAPDSAEYSLGLADVFLVWKQYSAALAFLLSARSRLGNAPEYQYKLALAYFGSEQYDRAINVLQALDREHPDLDLVNYFLGNSFVRTGDLKEAQSYFNRAIQLDPKNPSYYAALSELLMQQGEEQLDRAVRALQKALSIDPDHVTSKLDLALCYEKKKEYEPAHILLEEITRKQADLLPAHVVLARIDHKLGKKEDEDSETATIWRLNALRASEEEERVTQAKALLSQLQGQGSHTGTSTGDAPPGGQFRPR
jgi:cytochrome c-type biogenesis protein CcmH/NrfG